MGYKATKVLTSGNEGMFILNAGEAFQRNTNLPSNWKRVRVCAAISWTGLTADNGGLVNESVTGSSGTGFLYDFMVGFTNGVSYPGTSGNKFIGIAFDNQNTQSFLTSASGVLSIRGNSGGTGASYFSQTFSNGTSIYRKGYGNSSCDMYIDCGNPINASSCMYHFVFELVLGADSTVSANRYSSAPGPSSSASNTSVNSSLAKTLATLSATGSVSGWWTATTPVDCTYFYIRSPYPNNRLRIHNIRVMLLETF